MAGEQDIDYAKISAYAENSSRVGSALSALFKHDGWQIFLALWKRKKDAIKERVDYTDDTPGIIDFKGDRKAVALIDELLEEMQSFVEEADAAGEALAGISPEPGKSRGIMLIESMEDSNREA